MRKKERFSPPLFFSFFSTNATNASSAINYVGTNQTRRNKWLSVAKRGFCKRGRGLPRQPDTA